MNSTAVLPKIFFFSTVMVLFLSLLGRDFNKKRIA
jgi:hypothetical protein